MDHQKIMQRIDSAIEFLKNSTQQLDNGKLISLDEFQNEVRNICEELTHTPVQDMNLYSAKLEILADFLRNFEVDLRARQAEVNHELMSLDAKQKAAKSYSNVSHATPKLNDNGN